MNVEERIATLSHAKAAATLRFLERQGCKRQEEMRALCECAAETAPEGATAIWQRRLDVYWAGRIVRWKTGEITALDGVPVQLIDSINAIEEDMNGEVR